jgi:hypothetical protein
MAHALSQDHFFEFIMIRKASSASSPNVAKRRLNACFRQALGILDRDYWVDSVAVMHKPAPMRRSPPIMESLLSASRTTSMRGS